MRSKKQFWAIVFLMALSGAYGQENAKLRDSSSLICKGQIVTEITGKPIWGAVVFLSMYPMRSDASSFLLTQWNNLKELGPTPDPNTLDLLQLQKLIYGSFTGQDRFPFAVTNSKGEFQIVVEREKLSSSNSYLGFLAKDYLGVQLHLLHPGGLNLNQQFDADENGIMTIPTIKMSPAATIRIYPLIPDTGISYEPTWLKVEWKVASEATQNRQPQISNFPLNNIAMMPITLPTPLVQANINHTAYVPAGKNISVNLVPQVRQPLMPVNLGVMHLYPGQIKNLGRIQFHVPIEIIVKAVDASGKPLTKLTIQCAENKSATDDAGVVHFKVGAYSSGKIVFNSVNLEEGQPIETNIPYHVEGSNDAGKIFTFQIPETYLGVYRSIHPKKN